MRTCEAETRPHIGMAIVDPGNVTEVFATGVLPIVLRPHYALIAFVADYPWDGPHGPERHVKLHAILTPEAVRDLFAELAAALRGNGADH